MQWAPLNNSIFLFILELQNAEFKEAFDQFDKVRKAKYDIFYWKKNQTLFLLNLICMKSCQAKSHIFSMQAF